MYNGCVPYNSPPAELSNNPFLEHSSNPLTRYPDVSGSVSPTNSQFTSWIGQPTGVPQQQGYNTYGPQPAQQQYTAGWGGSPTYQTQGLGYANPQQQPQQQGSGYRFQPSSSFGQQLSSAVDGGYIQGGAGYQQQQPQPQQQFTGYGTSNGYTTAGVPGQIQIPQTPYQQTGVMGPGYLSELDPYGPIGQGDRADNSSNRNRNNNSHTDTRRVGERRNAECPNQTFTLAKSPGNAKRSWKSGTLIRGSR